MSDSEYFLTFNPAASHHLRQVAVEGLPWEIASYFEPHLDLFPLTFDLRKKLIFNTSSARLKYRLEDAYIKSRKAMTLISVSKVTVPVPSYTDVKDEVAHSILSLLRWFAAGCLLPRYSNYGCRFWVFNVRILGIYGIALSFQLRRFVFNNAMASYRSREEGSHRPDFFRFSHHDLLFAAQNLEALMNIPVECTLEVIEHLQSLPPKFIDSRDDSYAQLIH